VVKVNRPEGDTEQVEYTLAMVEMEKGAQYQWQKPARD